MKGTSMMEWISVDLMDETVEVRCSTRFLVLLDAPKMHELLLIIHTHIRPNTPQTADLGFRGLSRLEITPHTLVLTFSFQDLPYDESRRHMRMHFIWYCCAMIDAQFTLTTDDAPQLFRELLTEFRDYYD
jgi:hypothetical protein